MMSSSINLIIAIVGLITLGIDVSRCNPVDEPGPVFRGVTIRSIPYLEQKDDHFEGFIVDLMEALAKKMNIQYSLYLSPDGRYGNAGLDGVVNGMLGELNNSKADFAIADLTVTEARKRYVDFTEPFLVTQLGALVRKSDAIGLNSLEDLANLDSTGANGTSKPLVFGTLRTGATNYLLSKSEDPVGKKLYEMMQKNGDESYTKNLKEGIDRVVQSGGYAFIMESLSAEYAITENCNLTVLIDKRSLYPRHYAIALPQGSPNFEKFNTAIKELVQEGKVEELKKKYWANNCDQQSMVAPTTMLTPTI